jgi:putative restriction endonuclease
MGPCSDGERANGTAVRAAKAQIGGQRAPHKPLLLLWLLGRFAAAGSARAPYAEAADPVSRLINDFGPSVKGPALERQRAAMPFVHLERDLWELRDRGGDDIGPDAPERARWLLDHGAVGELRPEVTALLADSTTLAAAARLLLDQHFTPVLSEIICTAVNLDLAILEAPQISQASVRRPRAPGFAEEVLRAYAYRCAMCGFDGRLGRNPVAIEAAHVRWHSQDGPDELANAIALCSLHHALFDCGVLGLSPDPASHRIPAVCRDQRGGPCHRRPRRPATTERPPRQAVCRRHLRRLAHDPGLQKPQPQGRMSTNPARSRRVNY